MPNKSILRRLLTYSLVLTAVVITVLSILSFLIARSLLTQRVLAQLSSVVSAREDLLEEVIRSDRERTALVAQQRDVRDALVNRTSTAALQDMYEQIRAEHSPLIGIALFDQTGRLVADIGTGQKAAAVEPSGTTLLPILDPISGWIQSDVYAPVTSQNRQPIGYLLMRYDTTGVTDLLFEPMSLGVSEQVLIGREQNGLFHVIDTSTKNPEDHDTWSLPAVLFEDGREGIGTWKEGVQSFIGAYRSVPSLGWGIIVQVDEADALAGTRKLGISFFALGLLLLELAGLVAFILARRFTAPILQLSSKIRTLRPGHWDFAKTVDSGDEIEQLDRVVADLTSRLKSTYDHLEEEIAARTQELQQQYALDRGILESIEQGVIAADWHGRITEVNPAACRMLQLDPSAVKNQDATEILQLRSHHRTAELAEHPVTKSLRTHQPFRTNAASHITLQRKDETLLPVIFTITPLCRGTECFGIIIVFQDFTKERQVDYLKSEFISLASHQLRTPLSSIRWYVDLLSDPGTGTLAEGQLSFVGEIKSASSRMVNLLDALLRVARLEEGGFQPEKQRVDLAALMREVTQEWKGPTAELSLDLNLALSTNSVVVTTDPMLVRIVLQNLISNSMKYSTKGGRIDISVNADDQFVSILVKDVGLGIPKSEQPRLFEKFFRAHNVRQMDTDGSGLGLYITKTILETLNGSISFESEEGKGATFKVMLPRV